MASEEENTDCRVTFCTCPATHSEKIARLLVGEKLAACVNKIEGVTSTYRWEGEVQVDTEDLLIIKTTTDRRLELRGRLVEVHPYSVPEVIELPIVAGHAPYLAWLRAETNIK